MKTLQQLEKEIKDLKAKLCCLKTVRSFDTLEDFPTEGEDGVIYIDESNSRS
jgi:ribosomal protein L29